MAKKDSETPIDLSPLINIDDIPYTLGGEAILDYRKGGRRVRSLIRVVKISILPAEEVIDLSQKTIMVRPRYTVRSISGGELVVDGSALRPGGLLELLGSMDD